MRPESRDSWCTPLWLAQALGSWDLDPCSNERSHIAASRTFSIAAGTDGLALAERMESVLRVFVNPPYSRGAVARWFSAYHHTRWCFLLRFDPSTEWFEQIYAASALICVPKGRRVNFEPPPGIKASSNVFPHALFYRREEDATVDILRLCINWRKQSS